jgi:hypothetical protein
VRTPSNSLGTRSRRLATATLLVLIGSAGASSTDLASASGVAAVVGQIMTPDAVNSCGAAGNSLELFQTGRTDGTSYVVPSDGVITSWSFRGSGLQARSAVTLRVYRPTPAGTPGAGPDRFRPVGDGGPVTDLGGDHDSVVATRLSVKAGDIVGLRSEGVGGAFPGTCAANGDAGDTYRVLSGATPTDFGIDASYAEASGLRIDVSAKVEPDVDADGYGDVTQDACPRLAASQDPCPIPNTTIIAHPASRTSHHTARFRFRADVAGATFRCKLDHHRYKPCTTPHLVTVKPGRHTIKVRAHANRATDPTPATIHWRVLR